MGQSFSQQSAPSEASQTAESSLVSDAGFALTATKVSLTMHNPIALAACGGFVYGRHLAQGDVPDPLGAAQKFDWLYQQALAAEDAGWLKRSSMCGIPVLAVPALSSLLGLRSEQQQPEPHPECETSLRKQGGGHNCPHSQDASASISFGQWNSSHGLIRIGAAPGTGASEDAPSQTLSMHWQLQHQR